MKKKKSSGFTLVEVLLAAALVGILFAGLSGILVAVRQPAIAWEGRVEAQKRTQALLERFQQDLFFALEEAAGRPLPFRGSSSSLEFFTAPDLQVSYRYFQAEGKLERAEKRLPRNETASQILKAGKILSNFKFRFLGKSGWAQVWKEEGWPRAIEVQGVLTLASGKAIPFEKKIYPIR